MLRVGSRSAPHALVLVAFCYLLFLFSQPLHAQTPDPIYGIVNVWASPGGPYTPGQNVTIEAYIACDYMWQPAYTAWYPFWGDCTFDINYRTPQGSFSLYDNSTYLGSYSNIGSYSSYFATTCVDAQYDLVGCQIEATYNVYEWPVTLSPGSHTFTLNWSGWTDPDYDTPQPVMTWAGVSGNTSLSVPLASPSLSVSASPSSFGRGTNTTITATISGGSNPTGTVTLYLDGNCIGSAGVSGSTATLSTGSSWSVGSHTLTAYYGGDSGNSPASSGSFGVTVNKANSATSVSSSANPSTYGESVTFTAMVTSGATGSVTFKDGGTTLGSGTISGTTATYTTSGLTGGSHSITAVYGGDTNFSGSTSSVLTQTVNQASSTVSVGSFANPSTYGGPVTFTATVTSGATGTVTFKDGVTTLGSGPVSGTTATYTTSTLMGGTHSITAVYGGDSNFSGSTSGTLTQTVNTTGVTVTVTSNNNPAVFGSSVALTITLNSSGVVPTGTVTLTDGVTALGTLPLNGSGVASFTTSAFTAGSHSLTATYNGDSNYH